MRRFFLWMSMVLIGLFTSCSKDVTFNCDGGDVETAISISVPVGAFETRAAIEGSNVFADPEMTAMRVALIVSNEEGKVLNIYQFDSHNFGTGPANFKIRFIKGQKYYITAWADFGAEYYTLPSTPDAVGNLYDAVVSVPTTRTGSLNANDCYFKNELIQITENQTINLVLKRPVALVKVSTNDWDLNEVKYPGFRPDFYQMKVTAPTNLNLISGVAYNQQEITCAAQIVEYTEDGSPKEMHFDYFLANTESSILPAFTVKYYQGGQVQTEVMSDFTFENIPVQRNYKTNITGNILTKLGDINVTVTNTWFTPDKEIFVREVNTPSETYDDLNNYTDETKSREYVVQSASSTDNTIIIPDETQAASLTYIIKDLGTSNEIAVEDETPGESSLNYPYEVTIQIPEVTGEKPTIHVNTPSAHVTVVGDANVVYANTSQNTFAVAEGSTVVKIVAQKGNIEIHGAVTDIVRDAKNADAVTYVDIYDNGVWTNEAQNQDAKVIVRRPVAKIGETIYLSMTDAFAAAQAGDEIIVTAASVAMPAINKSDVTVKSTIATKVTSFGGVNSEFENVTFDGFEFACTASGCQGKNLTIKNCKFTGEFGLRDAHANTLMTIESCEFAQTGQYGIHFNGANGSVVVNNSKIKGAVAGSLPCITFNKSEFAGRSNSGHCNINICNKGVFNECTFTADYTSGQYRGILMLGEENSARVALVNCSMKSDGNITDIFLRDSIQGLAEINAEKNDEGKYTSGTFVTPDAALITTAPGYAAKNDGNNVYTIVASDSWQAFAASAFESIDKSAKTITIASAEQLALLALNMANGESYSGYTISLNSDIDLSAYVWTPISEFRSLTFDGQNHTISNMVVNANNASGNAFVSYGYNAVIKNVTFDNATVRKGSDNYGGDVYAVVMAYAGYHANATFEGVTVKNSLVNACCKVGAIAGMAEMQGDTILFKNCKVESTTLKGAYNVAGFIGNFLCSSASGDKNTIKFEGTNTSDVILAAPAFPYRNFEAPAAVKGLNGMYLKSGNKYYAQFAKFYNASNCAEATDKNADAIIVDTPTDIIPK